MKLDFGGDWGILARGRGVTLGLPPTLTGLAAYREILDLAAKEETDVIVMGVRGRNALDLTLFGSTTNQVVRRATCPVLTLMQ